ncbi:hypothetical protein ACFJGW_03920 [Burkholderiaceae bacterium UC74_6]
MMKRRDLLALSALAPLSAWAQAPRRDWFIFLERGKPSPADKAEVQRMMGLHLGNFMRLFNEGTLDAAGPMRDPSGLKRGIVVVKAATRDELMSYFQPDEFVRDGFMTVNAAPARALKVLRRDIDPNAGIEEARIALVPRSAGVAEARIRTLLDSGSFGAGYALDEGELAYVLFALTTDSAPLEKALEGTNAQVWTQYIGKGVIR